MTLPNTPLNDDTSTPAAASTARPAQTRRRWLLAGVTAAAIATLSATGITQAAEGWRGHHGGMGGMSGPFDPEKAGKHIERMLEHAVPDASADQKSRIATIVKTAMTDLQPLKQQHRAGKAEAVQLLSANRIDRNALERLRVAQMQLAQQASIRMTQAMADAAEVLTPDQRVKLGARLQERMQRHMGQKG